MWKPKVKTFQIIAENIPNNIRIQVPMKVCMVFMSELERKKKGGKKKGEKI